MSEELKPCPFCGNTGQVVKIAGRFAAECLDSCAVSNFFRTEKDARKQWNTRPIEDALKSENARLTAEVELLKSALDAIIAE